jgi:two-component system, sensor histidine kinase
MQSIEVSPTQPDYVCIAAALLEKMLLALQSAEANCSRLALAMATAGHDLRQRLHLLMAAIELLAITDEPVRAAELRRDAKSLIYRLANELEQLAVLAERDSRQASPVRYAFELAPVLEQIQRDWLSEARSKELDFKCARSVVRVESDPYLLAVIVNNAVANAVRYTEVGEVCLDCRLEENCCVLEIRDTGPGISEVELERSFGSLARSTSSGGGLGLGLSIIRRTAKLLGHTLDVESDKAHGTCVRLTIPLAESNSICAYDTDRSGDEPNVLHLT